MSTKLHVATWKRIIGALIPSTTIESQSTSYDDMMNYIYEKDNYFRVSDDIIFHWY